MSVEAIQDLSLWPERPLVERLAGGFTNENYRVTSRGRTYFARLAFDQPRHAISRANEYACARLAAAAGIAPQVVHTGDAALVTEYVHGQTLQLGEVLAIDRLVSIAQLLASVHRMIPPQSVAQVDLVATCQAYLGLLRNSHAVSQIMDRAADILAAAPRVSQSALIHGDAFPENFIDDGQRLWLVDWEYAGRGAPEVDLAFVVMNWELSAEETRTLLNAYSGTVRLETVTALVPLAALRDALWCLVELESTKFRPRLAQYSHMCLRRLGISFRSLTSQ
jgi:thiamine kinase-like enzyme